MEFELEPHTEAILHTSSAALELVGTLPETDMTLKLRSILEDQFDILDCVINDRHFGSDSLDNVINTCQKVMDQIKEMENNQ